MSVQQPVSDSRMPGENKYVEAVLAGEDDLERDMYIEEGTEIEFYAADERLGTVTYETTTEETVEEALLMAVADDEDAAGAAYEALDVEEGEIGMRMVADPDSLSDVASRGLDHLSYVASEVSQDVMEHEHREGMCNCCGAEMDMVVAQPGDEDLDVYLYECDDCGNEGHYFGGEETEDGAVSVWSEFTDEAALSREVDVREGAKVTVYDLGDVPENPLEREPDQGRVYSMEVGNGWKTRPDGLLQRLLDRPVPMTEEVERAIEAQLEEPNMGVLIEDPTGGSDVEETPEDHYLKVVDESQVEFQGIR